MVIGQYSEHDIERKMLVTASAYFQAIGKVGEINALLKRLVMILHRQQQLDES